MVSDGRAGGDGRTDGPPLDGGPNRAQLILIGAIAIAVVIVGLAVVTNSLLVTQTSGSTDAALQSNNADQFDFQSRADLQSLFLRMNHRHRNLSASELATVVDRNATVYSRLLSESSVASGGETVNVTYDNDSSAFGDRLVQANDAPMTDSDGSASWRPISSVNTRAIGWFTMNVNVDATSEEPTQVIVENGTGETITYEISKSGSDVLVESDVSTGGSSSVVCSPSRDRVLLDFEAGESATGDCEFDSITAIEGPVFLDIEDGDALVTKYELVADDTLTSPADYEPCLAGGTPADAAEPCTAPAVWTANVSVQFTGSQVSYTNQYNVSVYGDSA